MTQPQKPDHVRTVLEAVRDVRVTLETIRWHRCADVMPKPGDNVLVSFDPKYCGKGMPQVWIGYWVRDFGDPPQWYEVSGDALQPTVTHWASLPIGAATINREGDAPHTPAQTGDKS